MTIKLSSGFLGALMTSKGVVEQLQRGVIEIYAGTRPATASAAVPSGATLLAVVTADGQPFTPNTPNGGLEWLVDGVFAAKNPSQAWKFTGLANGTPAWFRIKGNAPDAGGESLSLPRVDGDVGFGVASTAEFVFPDTAPTIALHHMYALDQFQFFFPN